MRGLRLYYQQLSSTDVLVKDGIEPMKMWRGAVPVLDRPGQLVCIIHPGMNWEVTPAPAEAAAAMDWRARYGYLSDASVAYWEPDFVMPYAFHGQIEALSPAIFIDATLMRADVTEGLDGLARLMEEYARPWRAYKETVAMVRPDCKDVRLGWRLMPVSMWKRYLSTVAASCMTICWYDDFTIDKSEYWQVFASLAAKRKEVTITP